MEKQTIEASREHLAIVYFKNTDSFLESDFSREKKNAMICWY